MYVHLWCEHRGSGREFSASCVYEDNEDDESRESQNSVEKPKVSRKCQKQDDRRDSNDAVAILPDAVSKLMETEATSNKGALIE
ncbi:hypothetical protein GQ600_18378 [Phytophthora cactorum]|nr:hypothetical protein GQ600_18378 [Phytophthora cactorum]